MPVLIVDDVRGLRVLLRLALEESGEFRIVGEAGDGEEAIAKARELQPRLVLLDLAMPRMDGLEALPLLRAASPGSVVVVLSGFAEAAVGRQARDAGAAAFIEKGLVPAQLVARLKETLRAASRGTA